MVRPGRTATTRVQPHHRAKSRGPVQTAPAPLLFLLFAPSDVVMGCLMTEAGLPVEDVRQGHHRVGYMCDLDAAGCEISGRADARPHQQGR